MKLKDLIKDGWPEAQYTHNEEYKDWNEGWNQCLAAIEPIKELEVRIKKEAVLKIIMQWTSVIDDRGLAQDIVDDLAANLDNFLLIERVDNA